MDKRLGGNKRTKSKEIHAVTAHNPLQGLKKPLLQSKAEEKDVEKGTHFNVSKKNGDGEERSDILESRMNEQLEELEELKEEHDLQNKRKKMSYCEKLYSYVNHRILMFRGLFLCYVAAISTSIALESPDLFYQAL